MKVASIGLLSRRAVRVGDHAGHRGKRVAARVLTNDAVILPGRRREDVFNKNNAGLALGGIIALRDGA
jgi:hypothetical protein